MEMTVDQLISLFDQHIQVHNAAGTVAYYRYHLSRFARVHGSRPVSSLRKWDLVSWAKTWHQFQAVQRLFAWATDDTELIAANPFKGVRRPAAGGRMRILTPREMVLLMRSFCPAARRFFFAMRETIARPQEIRALCWEHLRWDGCHATAAAALRAGAAFFVLDEFKGRTRRKDQLAERYLFITDRLARLLLRLLERSSSKLGRIFADTTGQQWTANAVRLQMRRACDRVGLDRDRRGEQIVPYTLRHTVATMAVAAGVTDRTLADVMGHTTTRTTARYQHLTRDHLKEAFEKINRHRSSRRNRKDSTNRPR